GAPKKPNGPPPKEARKSPFPRADEPKTSERRQQQAEEYPHKVMAMNPEHLPILHQVGNVTCPTRRLGREHPADVGMPEATETTYEVSAMSIRGVRVPLLIAQVVVP